MHNSKWWASVIYNTIKVRQTKWQIEVCHFYVSAEPFTSIFTQLKNDIILKTIDKTLDTIEKVSSHPMFANQLMVTLITPKV
jgi:hypothetical protein